MSRKATPHSRLIAVIKQAALAAAEIGEAEYLGRTHGAMLAKIAMAVVIREQLRMSYPDIAAAMGYGSHSSVISLMHLWKHRTKRDWRWPLDDMVARVRAAAKRAKGVENSEQFPSVQKTMIEMLDKYGPLSVVQAVAKVLEAEYQQKGMQ